MLERPLPALAPASLAGLSAVVLLAAPAPAQCSTDFWAPPGVGVNTAFGRSLAADGDWIAVGGAGGLLDQGRVWMLRRGDAGGFELEQVLTPVGSAVNFGLAVELRGTTLVVGAPNGQPSSGLHGSVFVYELAGEQWQLEQRFQPETVPVNSMFGFVLALDGPTLAVGAWNEQIPLSPDGTPYAQGAGGVFLYRDGPGGWAPDGHVTAPDPQNIDWFGYAVAVSGDRLVVGHPRDDDDGSESGSVRTFRRGVGGGWTPGQTLHSTPDNAGGEFGAGLALDGDRLVVASPRGEIGEEEFGLVDLFELQDDLYVHVDTYDFGQDVTSTGFSDSLALDGDRLAVGAWRSSAWAPDGGVVFLLDRLGTDTVTLTEVPQAKPGSNHNFGRGLALDGDDLLVTAPFDGTFGVNGGALEPVSILGEDCLSLFGSTGLVSLTKGNTQVLELKAQAELAGQVYVLLGSASGTAPGLPVDGLVLPLVYDAYTQFTLTKKPNKLPLYNTLGVLSGFGVTFAIFDPPDGLDPAFVGLTLHHAYVVFDDALQSVVHASNALPVVLVE